MTAFDEACAQARVNELRNESKWYVYFVAGAWIVTMHPNFTKAVYDSAGRPVLAKVTDE